MILNDIGETSAAPMLNNVDCNIHFPIDSYRIWCTQCGRVIGAEETYLVRGIEAYCEDCQSEVYRKLGERRKPFI